MGEEEESGGNRKERCEEKGKREIGERCWAVLCLESLIIGDFGQRTKEGEK